MHNKRYHFIILIGFLLTSLLVSGCGHKLEYGLSKGDECNYKLTTSVSTTDTTSEKKTMTTKQTMNADISQKVVDVDKKTGDLTIEVAYQNIKTSASQDGKTISMPPVKDTSFEMKINKRGKLVDFTGEDVYMEEYIKKFSGTEAILPEKAIKKGETWENTDSMEVPFPPPTGKFKMKQEIKNKYTFEAVEKFKDYNCAKIKIETTITQKLDKIKEGPVSLEFNGKGTISGFYYFSLSKGRVVKTSTDTIMSGALTIQEDKKAAQKMSNDVKSSMTMELEK